ncbi:MAG: alkaline phosphatase D family protein [Bacteroidia bacterium]
MKKQVTIFVCAIALCLAGFSQSTKIAFGSCGHQDHPLPIFDVVVKHQPDYFIFLGDNIYGDTYNMAVLKEKYAKLGAKPTFQNLKKNTKILATWDDHDYGANDSGKNYPFKVESKQLFLDFFEEPADSERRKHEGIYTSYLYEIEGKKLQIILLDGRTFRDKLKNATKKDTKKGGFFYDLDYVPHTDTTTTLLGETQWKWLEGELQKPADLRIIGSGTQFGIEFNGYEAWANFPHEQARFFRLIQKTKANGVIFISGDVHYAEISKREIKGLYPIYDITSSGLSSTWKFATPNKYRIEGPIMDNHFGLLTLDWKKQNLTMEIWDIFDNQRIEYTIPMGSIKSFVETGGEGVGR